MRSTILCKVNVKYAKIYNNLWFYIIVFSVVLRGLTGQTAEA